MKANHGVMVRIDESSQAPLYRQIADSVRKFLVNGTLRPGDRLPTVRQLAIDLAVNLNTVAKAYRVLEEEGWVQLKRGRGATVRERSEPQPSSKALPSWRLQLEALLARARSSGLDAGALAFHLREIAEELQEGAS